MRRFFSIFRSLVVAGVLTLAVSALAVPAAGPAAPVAFGCNGPPIGYFVDAFATCDECESIGSQGASEGMWTTWRCRAVDPYYHLYVT